MMVYRCINRNELESVEENRKLVDVSRKSGVNNFYYSRNSDYKHFFLFAESARHYQGETYGMIAVMQCDIPYELLAECSGIGYYNGIIDGYRIPIPEFAVPEELFKPEYIKDIADSVKPEWKKENDFKEYLESIPQHLFAPSNSGRCTMEDYSNSVSGFNWQKYMKKS